MTARPLLPCPCGQDHDPEFPGARLAYDQIAIGLPPTVLVRVQDGAWWVPRIFIAVHGLVSADLARLAARYGFRPEPVS